MYGCHSGSGVDSDSESESEEVAEVTVIIPSHQSNSDSQGKPENGHGEATERTAAEATNGTRNIRVVTVPRRVTQSRTGLGLRAGIPASGSHGGHCVYQ
jgi:hypothetical protein